jgi:23S rRNA (uracil1939-C5)-methyltransferase/tRNA (uracil-5-)-methyltransferase
MTTEAPDTKEISKIAPPCPVFGACGGCEYQDLSYEDELALKERRLHRLFDERLGLRDGFFDAIVASPLHYHYRNRIDLTLRRTRDGNYHLGFQREDTRKIVPVEACLIAREEISRAIPVLKGEAEAKLPPHYQNANLTVRTGDDRRVVWGGIGRRSLEMKEEDYFYVILGGRKIFYSLDTFFQANTAILPLLMDRLEEYGKFDRSTVFYDLYAGVGLFGIYFADRVARTVMVEENVPSLKLMKYNAEHHGLRNVAIREGKVERELAGLMEEPSEGTRVAIIDPPRRGLSDEVAQVLAEESRLETLFYLSCSPASLMRDLECFLRHGWNVRRVTPFDFFPRTRHLETLVMLEPSRKTSRGAR